MMNNKEMITYDLMVEFGIATPEELNLARNLVDGSWLEVLNAVVKVKTGYSDFDSYIENEMEEEEEDPEMMQKILRTSMKRKTIETLITCS